MIYLTHQGLYTVRSADSSALKRYPNRANYCSILKDE